MLLVLVDLIPNCVKLYFLKFCGISSHHTEKEDYESIESMFHVKIQSPFHITRRCNTRTVFNFEKSPHAPI